MATDNNYSIKTMLFTKAIPNYVIPFPTNGHKVFSCVDCGDKFIFESSFDYHINRKTVHITYFCRYCNTSFIFKNRCKLLQHIRSHVFKTTTINLSDLRIDLLPLEGVPIHKSGNTSDKNTNANPQTSDCCQVKSSKNKKCFTCYECGVTIDSNSGFIYKERANHYNMQITKERHTCPACLFTLPNECALGAHLRIHLKLRPCFCPECGIYLYNKLLQYPYSHNCTGFKMMRMKTRIQCPVQGCRPFHPSEYNEHMKENHLKVVYKCPECVVACFTKTAIDKHMKSSHNLTSEPITFYQCQLCPGRLVWECQMENHIKLHYREVFVYPCWSCGANFYSVGNLINHVQTECVNSAKGTSSFEKKTEATTPANTNVLYRVVKQCDRCKRSITYKCKYPEIGSLPSNCPFNCFPQQTPTVTSVLESMENSKIKCPLCMELIAEEWSEIKKHFNHLHKTNRCLDLSVVMERVDLNSYKITKLTKRINKSSVSNSKRIKKSRRKSIAKVIKLETLKKKDNILERTKLAEELICVRCNKKHNDKNSLEEHMITHRDPCAAYQCLECGVCFVVKRSFATHLLVYHQISDVEDYIKKKTCFNQEALQIYQNDFNKPNEPLKEYQCKVCRLQYDNDEQLEKHSRVHGMAFLVAKKFTVNK